MTHCATYGNFDMCTRYQVTVTHGPKAAPTLPTTWDETLHLDYTLKHWDVRGVHRGFGLQPVEEVHSRMLIWRTWAHRTLQLGGITGHTPKRFLKDIRWEIDFLKKAFW